MRCYTGRRCDVCDVMSVVMSDVVQVGDVMFVVISDIAKVGDLMMYIVM